MIPPSAPASDSQRTEYRSVTLERLPEVATAVAAALGRSRPFVLWLVGDLGAGKTTVTGAILRAMGLAPGLPVTSPTYTYVNEYKIAGEWVAHLDLYRLVEKGSAALPPEDLGLIDSRDFRGYLIEWPQTLAPDGPLAPTHRLTISPGTSSQDTRTMIFETLGLKN